MKNDSRDDPNCLPVDDESELDRDDDEDDEWMPSLLPLIELDETIVGIPFPEEDGEGPTEMPEVEAEVVEEGGGGAGWREEAEREEEDC